MGIGVCSEINVIRKSGALCELKVTGEITARSSAYSNLNPTS